MLTHEKMNIGKGNFSGGRQCVSQTLTSVWLVLIQMFISGLPQEFKTVCGSLSQAKASFNYQRHWPETKTTITTHKITTIQLVMASLKNSKVQIPFNFGSFLRLRNRYGCCYIYKTEHIYNLCFCVRKLCKLLAFDSHGGTEVVWSEFHLLALLPFGNISLKYITYICIFPH